MNILMPYSAIKAYLDTNASPEEFARALVLSGPSIERWHETADKDTVFDIEITTNRVDTASAIGIAQEAAAILPRRGFKASLHHNPLTAYE